jgi:hypothetical protein
MQFVCEKDIWDIVGSGLTGLIGVARHKNDKGRL